MGYMTVAQAAQRLAVHEKTLRRYINNGDLQAKKVGGQWKIKEEWFHSFVAGEATCSHQGDFCVFMDSLTAEEFQKPACIILDFDTKNELKEKETLYKAKAFDMMEEGKKVKVETQCCSEIMRMILWCEQEDLPFLVGGVHEN